MIRSQRIASNNFIRSLKYERVYYKYYDFENFKKVPTIIRTGNGSHDKYNDVIIMLDTETSKKGPDRTDAKTGKHIAQVNHICAWSIAIRACNHNMVTLWGLKPSELVDCLNELQHSLPGIKTIIYVHNLSYDWMFIRKFMFRQFGFPESQLNTKNHYPLFINFNNGIQLRDSYILAQRSLAKWAKDLDVEHQKEVGKWDYTLIRNQDYVMNDEELDYIEHDVLAGVECIQKMKDILNKHIYAMPYTATGIPREESRNAGRLSHAHDAYVRMAVDFDTQLILEQVYHGGYTHGNRHYINFTINEIVRCYDFTSSYPYCLLAFKYPVESFRPYDNCSIDYILRNNENYAFIFKLTLIRPRLKNDNIDMPALQFSKATKTINSINDNGRILAAGYVEIYLTDIDLEVINQQYDYDQAFCSEVQIALKDYLPRWFTDYVFKLFKDKTTLKGGDPVAYALAKAKLNSLYGMCVQKPIKPDINEDYDLGDYIESELTYDDAKEMYNKFIKKRNTILPYSWGVYCTAYAFRNLHILGTCIDGTWYYSDTDSCYASNWNEEKLKEYNDNCLRLLRANGYDEVIYNGKSYVLGSATLDGEYSEFRVMGAKRYVGRSTEDGELHITVAGVPKSGVKCLNNDINNFVPGMIFSGAITNKKNHYYLYSDEIYIDEYGNECGDSIDLAADDYTLDSIELMDWEKLFEEEVVVQVYDEEELTS